jgi:hypothetical protein
MTMKEYGVRIVVPPYLRDPGLERRIVEYNRDALIYSMLVVGSVLLLIGFLW